RVLPFIEFACAVCLLLGVVTRLAALGVVLMGASFLITKIILLSRGPDVECGCFGAIGSTMASWSIYLDPLLVLFGIGIVLSGDDSRYFKSLGQKLSQKTRRRLRLIW
ncbi:MAG TPA: MauE/DoxX family redox-associated membrane protein, partial [Syntrophorhabdaceae bacterium]|nr:MauE/DoxX family redox-associated membrane protein [Syntrophorhabdaceae bacterium]